MKSFLKENLVLVAGVMLPLVLTLVFFTSTQIGKVSVDPPTHKVIYVTNYYPQHLKKPYLVTVIDEHIHFQYTPPDGDNNTNYYQKPKLFIYDPIGETTTEVGLPDIENVDEKIDIIPQGLENVRVNRHTKSPDGFVFESDYRGSGNLMTEMFGGGYRSRNRYVLEKEGAKFVIPDAETYNSHFIAWVLEEGEQ